MLNTWDFGVEYRKTELFTVSWSRLVLC